MPWAINTIYDSRKEGKCCTTTCMDGEKTDWVSQVETLVLPSMLRHFFPREKMSSVYRNLVILIRRFNKNLFSMSFGRVRNVMITLNNPTPEDTHRWTQLLMGETAAVRYFVFQSEIGDGTEGVPRGTPHFQGYAQMTHQSRLLALGRVFGIRCHFEKRRGSHAQALAYVTKNDTKVAGGLEGEVGTPRLMGAPVKGVTKQFVAAVNSIKGGDDLMDVEDANPVAFAMYPEKLVDFFLKQKGVRDWAMEIEIFVGPTGTGKSTSAKEENPGAYWGSWPMGGRWWWPGYRGENVVVLDDFFEQIRVRKMMELLDRHHFGIEAKGRNMEFVSHKLIITTNKDPCEWYSFRSKFLEGGMTNERRKVILGPLERRIRDFAKIYDFEEGHQYPGFSKTLRTVPFRFKDVDVPNYSTASVYGS